MEIASLIKKLREHKLVVKLVENQLEVSVLEGKVNADLIQEIKTHKQEIIKYLTRISATKELKEIPKVEKANSYPVSNAQLRIWLASQSTAASVAYHMPFEVALTGNYNITALEKAIQYIVKRHEILRTTFKTNEHNEVRQYITPETEVDFSVDYQDFSKDIDSEKQAFEYIQTKVNQPFNLEEDFLIRASILKHNSNDYLLFCNLHHIICDAWSIPVLKKEILQAYKSISDDQTPELPTLRIQYKDYASWYVKSLKEGEFADQRAYWQQQFASGIPVLEFPLKSTRPSIKTYNGKTLKTHLGKQVTADIHSYRKQHEASLYMYMLSTLYIMLNRYTGADDIVIGSPYAAREHIDLKNQIGFYTNTLAIRNQLKKGDTFNSFFTSVQQSVLAAYNHQQYPFDKLIEDLKLKKDLSRNPIFDVMLVVVSNNSTTETTETLAEEITLEKNTTSKFDLLFFIEEVGNQLSLKVEYNTDLYDEDFIKQFMMYYKKMLTLLLETPQRELSSIDYVAEKAILNTEIDLTKYNEENVISFFEKQVQQTPEAIAVCYKDISLTYQELNTQVNALASYLRNENADIQEKNIGALLERSHLNVIAMLGVIKSGACYVPINAAYQQEIKEFILDDAQISTIVSTTEIYKEESIQQTKILHLDTFDFTNQATENLEIINSLNDAAFIIYTSGSTGKPKGVIQTHQMLSNLIQWNTLDADIDSGLKHLQYTSFSFDVSLQDCWFTVSTGGTLFITPEEMKVDFKSLSDYIIQKEIEAIYFPYAAMSNFLEQVSDEFNKTHQLKHIISSGEQLTINKGIETFLNNTPTVKLHNHYGPSETHVVTSYTLSANEPKIAHVPIGKPVANTTIYLLDKNLQAVPTQVIGEIYVGGKNVAKGYVNLPELTKSRFIKNPFNSEEQLYKTGDLGVVNAHGILKYLGRNDDQVKIRGYRIELSAIKNALLNQEEIHQAYVTVIQKRNEKVLVAYILGEESIDTQQLKQVLGKELPEYMVPNYIKTVLHFPLTSNGKIDKDALPEITEEALVKGKFLAAETTVEKGLVGIWNKILETSSIGVLDNFFELGGHSLHITRMLHDINETFEVKLQMIDIFSSQNIQELAKLVEEEILFKKGTTTNITEQINNDKESEVWEL